jgi:putative pyruvate formate lyase activating enzyme
MWRVSRPDAVAVLEDELAKKSLHRYFSVLQYEKPAKFMLAKKVPAEWNEADSLEKLWTKHAKLTDAFCDFEREVDEAKNLEEALWPAKSYLDLKVEIANRIVQNCHFCTRRCGVNRLTSGLGYCGCGNAVAVSSMFAHLGEEPELVPSGTIFTMGCTMRCRHCQNWTISQWKEDGTEYTPEELAKEVERLRLNGCRNANLVGGEPTPWLKHWLETFKHVGVNVPVVWNSNSYYSQETARLLAGFVDVYLLDFKYGPGDCAKRISDASDYWEVCTRNHLDAKKNGELIIRVLVLPGHLECCTKPILHWIAENLGVETRVNLMFQYRPEWRAHEIPELRRQLSKDEMQKAVSLAREAGLKNLVT